MMVSMLDQSIYTALQRQELSGGFLFFVRPVCVSVALDG